MSEVQQAEASTSSAPVLFKKRNKSNHSSSRRSATDSPAPAPRASTSAQDADNAPEASTSTEGTAQPNDNKTAAQGDDDEEDLEGISNNLAELIALRKLRQSTRKEGIDLERLNAGAKDRKRKKKKQDEAAIDNYGLQGKHGKEESDDENEGDAITRKIMKTDNFTHQTGIVDIDKHMMAYIERELKKRRGQESGEFDADKELAALDPRDELFKVAEKYLIQSKTNQDEDEGNLATSSAMLTSIPEVDLGIDSRLKNIEATENAKRRLLDARERRAAGIGEHDDYHDATYAGLRYFRHARGNQTDFDALRAAKVEAGIEEDSEEEEYEKEMKQWIDTEAKKKRQTKEYATDDIVAERWKRSGANNPRGRGKGKR